MESFFLTLRDGSLSQHSILTPLKNTPFPFAEEFTIIFASPQAAEPNGHNLDTTLAQVVSVCHFPAVCLM